MSFILLAHPLACLCSAKLLCFAENSCLGAQWHTHFVFTTCTHVWRDDAGKFVMQTFVPTDDSSAQPHLRNGVNYLKEHTSFFSGSRYLNFESFMLTLEAQTFEGYRYRPDSRKINCKDKIFMNTILQKPSGSLYFLLCLFLMHKLAKNHLFSFLDNFGLYIYRKKQWILFTHLTNIYCAPAYARHCAGCWQQR